MKYIWKPQLKAQFKTMYVTTCEYLQGWWGKENKSSSENYNYINAQNSKIWYVPLCAFPLWAFLTWPTYRAAAASSFSLYLFFFFKYFLVIAYFLSFFLVISSPLSLHLQPISSFWNWYVSLSYLPYWVWEAFHFMRKKCDK